MTTNADEILTLAEVAALLKVDQRTVRRYIAGRGLPAFKLGAGTTSPWRFVSADVIEWLRTARVAA